MFIVEHRKASPDLASCVYGYVSRSCEPLDPQFVEPVVARTGSMLEFQFRDQFDVPIYGLDRPNLSDPITVIGPMRARNHRIIFSGRVEALTVLFRPLGFYRIFGIPLSPFTGKGTEGHSVLGHPISVLYERLGNLQTFAEKADLLELYLSNRLRQARPLHPASNALYALSGSGVQTSVKGIVSQTGISARQLERISADYCGLTPKALARIARFQTALRLKQASNANWTWIAQLANFHDQMHMIRDFRELAGDTPTRAMRNLSPDHLVSFMHT